MNNFKNYLIEFCKDEEGLTTVEYAVAGSMIAATVVGTFKALGVTVDGVIANINTQLGG